MCIRKKPKRICDPEIGRITRNWNIRKKTKKKNICDLCLYIESCSLTLTDDTYCDRFCHRSQGARLLCQTCRHNGTCSFNRYAKVVHCLFYRGKRKV